MTYIQAQITKYFNFESFHEPLKKTNQESPLDFEDNESEKIH